MQSSIFHHENHIFDSQSDRTFNALHCVFLIKYPQFDVRMLYAPASVKRMKSRNVRLPSSFKQGSAASTLCWC